LFSERLRVSKQLFEEGKINEARIHLDEMELDKDLTHLQTQQLNLTVDLKEVDQKLKHLSEEYLLKASLSSINFSDEKYIQHTKLIFDKAISAHKSYIVYYNLAEFLVKQKNFDEAINNYKLTLDFCEDNSNLKMLSNYCIGTIYIALDSESARQYLETSVRLAETSNNVSIYQLTVLGNSLHNLANTYAGQKKIELYEKAVQVRRQAANTDDKSYSLLSFSLQQLAMVEINESDQDPGSARFNKYFEDALDAMERFSLSKLDSPLILFQSHCLPNLITMSAIYKFYNGEKRFLALKDRFQHILKPYEDYVKTFHDESLDDIAKTYDQFNKHFIPWLDSDYSNFLSDKASFYYEQALKYLPPSDTLYFAIAWNLQLQGAYAKLNNDRKKGDLLYNKSLSFYQMMKVLDETAMEYYEKLKTLINMDCNCDECVKFRKGQSQTNTNIN
jgi:tetratricopeptide (TPR) repeat protein